MPGVFFTEDGHKYTNDTGERYTSVTSLISQYHEEFDKDFWSMYKAAERILSVDQIEEWKELKMAYLKSEDKKTFLKAVREIPNILKVQDDIIGEWRKTNKDATDYGSDFHNSQENKYRKAYKSSLVQGEDISFPFLCNKDNRGVFLELYVYNHELKLAGAIDRVRVWKNGSFEIVDFKTNRKLVFDTWKNPWTGSKAMMKYPLDHLPDCNYSHYTMQLSLYAWMLEQLGYKHKISKILHVVPVTIQKQRIGDLEDIVQQKCFRRIPYTVVYRKDEVEAMLKHWKENGKNKT